MHSELSRVEEIIDLLRSATHPFWRSSSSPQTRKGNRGETLPPADGTGIVGNREKSIVLVSDAGTPGISDPGSELIGRIRDQLKEEIESGLVKIEAIPGASALTAALSIAGVPCADFTFLGFLPHKKGRQTLFKEIAGSERTMVFYESPHRIMKTLEQLKDSTIQPLNEGTIEKRITICRELTKIFEEVVSGTAEEVERYFITHSDKVRGEFVVIVSVN
jgi:16S rRNA (cytidine1402-2'-O)-methyltransferase